MVLDTALSVQFTPHARGSTPGYKRIVVYYGVYPACAGIDPIELWRYTSLVSLPRMRGDRP